jgi:hypothetical protein
VRRLAPTPTPTAAALRVDDGANVSVAAGPAATSVSLEAPVPSR